VVVGTICMNPSDASELLLITLLCRPLDTRIRAQSGSSEKSWTTVLLGSMVAAMLLQKLSNHLFAKRR
jgi:hypothetical protein